MENKEPIKASDLKQFEFFGLIPLLKALAIMATVSIAGVIIYEFFLK